MPLRTRSPDRGWRVVAGLGVGQIVSWGVLYYAFGVVQAPMRADAGWSAGQTSGAFSAALFVAAIAGIFVGRWLDDHHPRPVLTAATFAGVAGVLGWSQADSLLAFYSAWVLIGIAMAGSLYEPAVIVVVRHHDPQYERAVTALTLIAGLASVVFVPLAQHLTAALGWRGALVVLAGTLAFVAAPVHALAVPRRLPAPCEGHAAEVADAAGVVTRPLRTAPFLLLAAAFAIAALISSALAAHLVPALLASGHGATFAAFAAAVVGFGQIPGRLAWRHVSRALSPHGGVIVLLGAASLALTVLASGGPAWSVLLAALLVGVALGMATLARASGLAELYGVASYGAIAGVAGALVMVSRALGPVVAAAVLALAGEYSAMIAALGALAGLAAVLAVAAGRHSVASSRRYVRKEIGHRWRS